MSKTTRIGAIFVFVFSLIIYIKTVAPTTSFWDCGEFIASAFTMGVPHPPGAPIYIMIGRVFTLLFPMLDVGLRVNLISPLVTALTVMIVYLSIARLIKEWRGEPKNLEDLIVINAGALVGSLSLAFSDTLWFNAVEAEVYGLSTLLTALVFWLTLLWMDYADDYKSVRYLLLITYLFSLATGVHLLNWLVAPALLMLIIFTYWPVLVKKGYSSSLWLVIKRIDLWTAIIVLLAVGLSAYAMIYIRSGLDPVIDENNPETLENFVKYVNREQYGAESQLTNFMNRKAPFIEYQVKKMYLRYFGWQYIGQGTTMGPDGYIAENLSILGLYGLPFFLGLIGFYYHFRRDWKRALSVLVFFLMTGIALIVYLNQPDPQPRERDYVYVGSFMAFALWIGIGMTGIVEVIFKTFREPSKLARPAAFTAIAAGLIIAPVNLFHHNYESHDRTGNYVPWDYSYNILESCEPNALLFTNGDNDTFPLWYLQEVEGIRKDVRIINLSLLNTNWYIEQLKNKEPAVAIALSDEQIRTIAPQQWPEKQTVNIKVEAYQNRAYMHDVELQDPDAPAELVFDVTPAMQISGVNILRVQDIMILLIIRDNQFRKPIYFAITVAKSNLVGLTDYLRLDGMAYKLVTQKNIPLNEERHKDILLNKFQFRGLNDPSVYFDPQTIGLLQNYRTVFLQLIQHYYRQGQTDKMLEVLDAMAERIPEDVIRVPNSDVTIVLGQYYHIAGRPEELESRMGRLLADPTLDAQRIIQIAEMYYNRLDNPEKGEAQMKRALELDPNATQAYVLLINQYEKQKRYADEIALLEEWLIRNPNDKNVEKKLNNLRDTVRQQNADTAPQETQQTP